MHTALDCIPCFARQALEAARFVTDDPAIHERLVREVLRSVADMDLTQSPVLVAQSIHRTLRALVQVDDPYKAVKDRFNRMALEMLPDLAAKIEEAADSLVMAVRVAISGNVIDLGVHGDMTEEKARASIDNVLHEPFDGDVDRFRESVDAARRILYLADNAGEIVFDRLLIERLPAGRVTLAVRGGPVLNDATVADARVAGLDAIVEVIDNGSDAPGTILTDCGEVFRQRFEEADLIIAKGQGNFETLSDEAAPIWFLLKVKCPVIATRTGFPVGTHVLARSRASDSSARRRVVPSRLV